MTPEEFDAAAHQLLQGEQDGSLRLPQGAAAAFGAMARGAGGVGDPHAQAQQAAHARGRGGRGGAAAGGWGDEDDERAPLNPNLTGAPARFSAADRQPEDAAPPMAPSRRRRGGPEGGPNMGGRGMPE